MASERTDQAEGLRQLFPNSSLRVIAVGSATAGVGKTSIVSNLAAAFASSGREVLVLDAARGAPLSTNYGVRTPHDLVDVVEGMRSLEQTLVPCAEGVRILPVARALRRLRDLNAAEQKHLVESFQWLSCPVDVVLVDTPSDADESMLCAGLAAQDTLLVVSRTTSSITANYALVKTLRTRYAMRRFRILVNKVADEAEARAIYLNMAGAAKRYLSATLEYAGHVPRDEKLQRAHLLSLPLIEAFPATPAAASFRKLAEFMSRPQVSRAEEGIEHFVQRLIRSSRVPAAGAAA